MIKRLRNKIRSWQETTKGEDRLYEKEECKTNGKEDAKEKDYSGQKVCYWDYADDIKNYHCPHSIM